MQAEKRLSGFHKGNKAEKNPRRRRDGQGAGKKRLHLCHSQDDSYDLIVFGGPIINLKLLDREKDIIQFFNPFLRSYLKTELYRFDLYRLDLFQKNHESKSMVIGQCFSKNILRVNLS